MPRTEAGKRLLNDLTKGGPHLIGPGHWSTAIDAIENEAAALDEERLARALMTTDSVPMPDGWTGYQAWVKRALKAYREDTDATN